ncbi:ABC-type sugar transport system, periplasmic component [Hahella chejuensis KCTC 2396]|uniref:ABC-type sugar transport system, periplasmic component n=1 Tax=Hahella chejuensis (strain KCTC 2396) TaxID=349521 RepID=Q2S7N7_HAHCH|nr:ABC transporter substrate-binding protein [Hahella chejuensis]ABC33337.1 ABC-type sugar transport system, periplasmic component [Hahella chejuensis KCTC 2396]
MVRGASLLVALLFYCCAASAAQYRFALLIPNDTPFWNRVALFAQSAAEDLNVELHVLDGDADRHLMLRQFERLLKERRKFDAIIFPNFLQTAETFIPQCEGHPVICVLYNSGLEGAAAEELGRPKQRFEHWIAQLLPDDVGSATAVTVALIRDVRTSGGSGGRVNMIAINGFAADGPAIAREKGLRAAVGLFNDVTLHQVVYTDWSAEDAESRTEGLLERFPNVNAIWSANYRTTVGVLAALKKRQRTPGRDVWVNSYDINPTSLRQVSEGALSITAGGHYVEGAWSVILAFDHLQGKQRPVATSVFHTPMLLANHRNAGKIVNVLKRLEDYPQTLRKVDFSRYSLALNPALSAYNFSLESVIEQMALTQ